MFDLFFRVLNESLYVFRKHSNYMVPSWNPLVLLEGEF